MLIVISTPEKLPKEAPFINRLFEAGLPLFHLRKPGYSGKEVAWLLKEIDSVYYPKIALHQHHHLTGEFGINRLHFPEKLRKEKDRSYFEKLKKAGNILSTSVHSIEAWQQLPEAFDYAFLSPVFDSISKPKYKGKNYAVTAGSLAEDPASGISENLGSPAEDPTETENVTCKLIALGGINAENCQQAYQAGFEGVAVLGAIWKSNDPVKGFIKLKEKCSTTAPSY